jgi:hypothetical protein
LLVDQRPQRLLNRQFENAFSKKCVMFLHDKRLTMWDVIPQEVHSLRND